MVAEISADRLTEDEVKALKALAQFVTKGSVEQETQKDIVFPHGTGGLLTYPGVRPDMYSTIPRVSSFLPRLPLLPSNIENERFEFITGVTAQTGTNPANTCDTPPKSGKMKIAQILATFGQFFKGTDEINLAEAGRRRDRADVVRRLRNPNFANPEMNPFVPTPPVAASAEAFNTVVGKTFMEFGQGVMLDMAYVLWRGDKSKANTDTYLGFITEFDGVDKWVKTGWTDVISGAPVAALDSQVINYNATLGSDFVLALSNMMRTLIMNADLKGTPNVEWEIVMHPRAMFAIFDIWACNYATARCLPTESNGLRLDVQQVNRLRDEMYTGRYLLVDGVRFNVSFDAGIEATQAEGGLGLWTSDVYVMPMDDGSGYPLSYLEYLPRDAANNQELAELMNITPGEVRVMNNGLYLAGFVKRQAFCFQYHFTSKLRFILERPDLAGRLDNVSFTSSTPFLDPYPGATYHRNGGTAFRAS